MAPSFHDEPVFCVLSHFSLWLQAMHPQVVENIQGPVEVPRHAGEEIDSASGAIKMVVV